MATWFVRSSAGGSQTGVDWANALVNLWAVASVLTRGDTIFVADDHSETGDPPGTTPYFIAYRFGYSVGSNDNLTDYTNITKVLCADHTVSSPTSSDLKIMSNFITGASNDINLFGVCYMYGISWAHPSSNINIGGGSNQFYQNCLFSVTGAFFAVTPGAVTIWDNCGLVIGGGCLFQNTNNNAFRIDWRNSSNTAFTGSTTGGYLFLGCTGHRTIFDCIDMSGATGAAVTIGPSSQGGFGSTSFKDCKMPASTPFIDDTTNGSANMQTESSELYYMRSDSANTAYRNEKYTAYGHLITDTTLIRTGGASDGTTAISWNATTLSNCKWQYPFALNMIPVYNTVTGSSVTVTIEGIADPRYFSALPKNDEVWIELIYKGTAGSTISSVATGSVANVLGVGAGSALTASTQAWDTLITARGNSTSYSLGDRYKVATNTGRVFICTTAGTSAGSEPGGLASAVDGGGVTDGTAVFTAAWRFKQAVSCTPQVAGPISVYPRMGKASATLYIDPKVTLS